MKRLSGFSLVELMVAITLALIVTAGVISVFVGSRTTYLSTSGTSALTDSGRFALNFVSNAVRNAGYMSCGISVVTVSILNAGPNVMPYSFNETLGGYEANGTGVGASLPAANLTTPVTPDGNAADWADNIGNLDATLSGLPSPPVKNNDILVVRSTVPNAQPSYVFSIVDGAPTFSVNQAGSLLNNQFAVISDCSKGDVFLITGSAPSGANQIITHNAGGGAGQNATSAFQTGLSFAASSQVTPVNTYAYFIGKGADGDGALFVYDLYNGGTTLVAGGGANELVPDVEAMQILYGLDKNNAQTVSQYVTAPNVTDFNSVMSVKIALLAAGPVGSAPRVALAYNLLGTQVNAPADGRARQVFEQTVGLRNSLH